MEDQNSWNDLIFYHINARREWLSSLIWRNRLKLEEDTSENKDDAVEIKKKLNLDPSDKNVIDWFNERQKNFKKLSEENTGSSSDEKTRDDPSGLPNCWSEVRNPEYSSTRTTPRVNGKGKK